MKNFIRNWIIPQGWISLAKKCIASPNKSDNFVQFDKENLEKFKDIHKGERCFILATGPSINQMDLVPLKDEHCISVGQFSLHPLVKEIKPQYHCFSPQHSPFGDETNKTIFDNLIKGFTFPVQCFIGTSNYEYSYHNFLKSHPEYKINANFVNYEMSSAIDEMNFEDPNIWDITQYPFIQRTVVYGAIQAAYYMGFNEIYLLGADHDYLKDINRTEGIHFYSESQSFNNAPLSDNENLEDNFREYYFRWKQYRLMKEFLNPKGIYIYNATPGSMLDVFPRVKFENLFNK